MNVGIERKIIVFSELDSTNAYALKHASREQWPEGSVVWAEHQTEGRGQRGNDWYSSPEKNLLCSIVLYPGIVPLSHQHYLYFIAALAVRDALASLELDARIKWPNDILVNEKKIAGILIQNSLQGEKFTQSVIGIGLNVNETCFPVSVPKATSVFLEQGCERPPGRILSLLLGFLDRYYERLKCGAYHEIEEAYLMHFYRRYEMVPFATPDGNVFQGKILGVNERGHLTMEVEGVNRSYEMKEIIWMERKKV